MGRLYYLAGLDGSGKSTQAGLFVASQAASGTQWTYRWARWEPWATGILMVMARGILGRGSARGAKRPEDDIGYAEFTEGKQKLFRKRWVREAWTVVVLLEYLPQAWWKLGGALLSKRLILCDRFLPDLWVDLSVNFGEGKEGVSKLARHPLCRLFPRLHGMVYLDVDPETGFRRKSDGTPLAYLKERQPLYLQLLSLVPGQVVDANGSVEEVSDALRNALNGLTTGASPGAVID